jgi:hypothetical protein
MNWKRDALVIPIVVGLVLAVFTYILPKLAEKGKQLSYAIEAPLPYVNRTLPDVMITIRGVQANNVVLQKVRIWNSGGQPLSNLPVRFQFTPQTKILSLAHATTPPVEFGEIKEQGSDAMSKRFLYALLNPHDSDTVTFLLDRPGGVDVYARAEGLELRKEVEKAPAQRSLFLSIAAGTIGLVASIISAVAMKIIAVRAHRTV